MDARLVLSGGPPSGSALPVASDGSRLERTVEAIIVTTFEARRENNHGCANPRPNPIAK